MNDAFKDYEADIERIRLILAELNGIARKSMTYKVYVSYETLRHDETEMLQVEI